MKDEAAIEADGGHRDRLTLAQAWGPAPLPTIAAQSWGLRPGSEGLGGCRLAAGMAAAIPVELLCMDSASNPLSSISSTGR